MPATYDSIATTTLGSAVSTITFSGISAGYTDLVLVAQGALSATSLIRMKYNNDESPLYSQVNLWGNGAGAGSTRNTSGTNLIITTEEFIYNSARFAFKCNIMSYASGYSKPTIVHTNANQANGTGSFMYFFEGTYRSSSAINRIDIYSTNTTFIAGTTVALYGILRA